MRIKLRLSLIASIATAIVMLVCSATAGAATLTTTATNPPAEQGIPLQLTFAGATDSVDSAYLYADVRPAGGVACQSTYPADQTAAGDASRDIVSDEGDEVTAGEPYSVSASWTPGAPGTYIICAWLEEYSGNSPGTWTGPVTTPVSVQGPQVSLFTVGFPAAPLDGQPFTVDYTTQTDQQLTVSSIIKPTGGLPCAASFEDETALNEPIEYILGDDDGDEGPSVFGGPVISPGTGTEDPGSYLLCAWVEGPTAGEVDATASTTFNVAGPLPPASPAIAISSFTATVSGGVAVSGTVAATLAAKLTVVATCENHTMNTTATPSAGDWSASLRVPVDCKIGNPVSVKVSVLKSPGFTAERVTSSSPVALTSAPPTTHQETPPTLFSTFHRHDRHLVNVFLVKPARIVLDSADGGELDVHWTHWAHSGASGHGIAHPDHGHYRVTLRASRPIDGTFACLTVRSRRDGHLRVDRLGLGREFGGLKAWLPVRFLHRRSSGARPWPGRGCPA